ncbi:amino acid adenylation domain-containing protein [Micromonospora sp. NPDC005710]|uniref:non-ribosomal peptide synthetase n=1 Tax=Micromonospora sp. NPDC005710 TaxID=3157051 RepID=UPI0033F7E746
MAVTDLTPLSAAQLSLWKRAAANRHASDLTVPLVLRLSGELDPSDLAARLGRVIDEHEALRVRIVDGVEPAQTVTDGWTVPVQDRLSGESLDATVDRVLREETARTFDLTTGPLFAPRIVRLAPNDHLLVLTAHQLAADPGSMRLIAAALTARPTGPAVSFLETLMARREWLRGDDAAAHRQYWKGLLATAPHLLELPLDRARPAVGRAVTSQVAYRFFGRAELSQLAEACSADLFAVLTAGVQSLLARVSGMEDFVLGTLPAAPDVVGRLVEPVPLRCDLTGDPTVAEAVASAHRVHRDAVAHAQLPFADIVELAGVGPGGAQHPLLQTMVTLHEPIAAAFALPGVAVSRLFADPPRSALDLTFDFTVQDAAVELCLGYSPDLWNRTTVEQLARYLATLLRGMAAEPHRPLGAVSMVAPGQASVVGTVQVQGDDPTFLHELVLGQAAATPDAVAVQFGDRSVSYRELVTWAELLSQRLVAVGVGPESRVGVCLERSVELVVGLLGVLMAGGAYVPLDPLYPAERLAFMATDAELTAVLTTEGSAAPVAGKDIPTVEVTTPATSPMAVLPTARTGVSPDNIAYVIYTSGSTGVPKGVGVTHRNLVNHMHWITSRFGIRPDERVLQRTSFSFDGSVWEFWMPLMMGGTLVVLEPDRHADLGYLVEHMERHRVTTAQLAPHLLSLFLDQDLQGRIPTLRNLFTGGEQLAADVPPRAAAFGPLLHNLYGPTEVTMNAAAWTTRRQEMPPVPVGVPVDNAFLCVIDKYGALVPTGVVGELLVGGAGVSRGYLGRAALTASRFVADPFSGLPGRRLYRTGDRVRRRQTGEFEFLGRVDDQVKVRGFRVELGEIESVVRASPDVAEAVVIAVGEREAARLVAYVVPAR